MEESGKDHQAATDVGDAVHDGAQVGDDVDHEQDGKGSDEQCAS